MKKIGKLVVFNLLIAILAIILFSNRIVGLTFNPGVGAIKFALSISVTFLLIALFFCVNYEILTDQEKFKYKMSELTTVNNCIQALGQFKKTDPIFKLQIDKAIAQLQALERKKMILNDLLSQNEVEESFKYLNNTANKANDYIFANVKRIINKLIVFDNQEYVRNPNSYNLEEYKNYIQDVLNENDLILKEYTNMLLALSSIGESIGTSFQEMAVMTEALNKVLKGKKFGSLEE